MPARSGLTNTRSNWGKCSAFVSLLRASAKNKDLCKGSRLHDDILKTGVLERCSDALITMYAKCGALEKAKMLIDMHKSRDVLTWTALISGYAQKGEGENAMKCFEQMQCESVHPDAVTFSCILKACSIVGAADKGEKIHDQILKLDFLKNDAVLGTALIDMYAKCGAISKAQQVLEGLLVRDVITWNALISGHTQHNQGQEALICFEKMQSEGLSPNAVTYACALKACGSIGAVNKGESIHDEIVQKGLLRNDIVLGNALADMYAKCHALPKAQNVIDSLPVRNALSWSILIAGYAQHDQGERALDCLEQMELEGFSPNEMTFTCILKACGSLGAADKGGEVHAEIVRLGLLAKDLGLGNSLVDMYAKCGSLKMAQEVLDEIPSRDVVAWSTLILGYGEQYQGEQALNYFEQMQREGLSPDAVTFGCILKACGNIGAAERGCQIHHEIVRRGLLANNVGLGNALVDMYTKYGALAKAHQVLEELPVRDIISWNTLITGYGEAEQLEQALYCFERMQSEGFSPNRVTFACILNVCGSIGAATEGERVHGVIVRQGLLCNDIVTGTAIVALYAKCGVLSRAQQMIEELYIRDVVAWSTLIDGYAQEGQGEQALICFERMQCEGISPDEPTFYCILKACGSIGAADKGGEIHEEIVRQGLLGSRVELGTALIDMYAKCGAVVKAQQVLQELLTRDTLSWSVLIAAYAQQGQGKQALHCLELMQHEGFSPDALTFSHILKACGSIQAAKKGEEIHMEILRRGLLGHVTLLGNALVSMYAKCGALTKVQGVLERLPIQDSLVWSALIAGYTQQGQGDKVLHCYEWMQHEGLPMSAMTLACTLKACGSIGACVRGEEIYSDIVRRDLFKDNVFLSNAVVDMYAKCGVLCRAKQVLDELPHRDVISWNALVAGYVHQSHGEQALDCFERMQLEGFSPNAVTFVCVLRACGSIGSPDKGVKLHEEVVRRGFLGHDIIFGSALVDMYAKCGLLWRARQVLEELPMREVVSWSALIAGYTRQGQGERALNCFREMWSEGISPDAAVFSCVLTACSFSGLVKAAEIFWVIANAKSERRQTRDHYICMVHLFGCAGYLDKAVGVIEKMQSPGWAVWSVLLGACQKWGDVRVGRWAFEHAIQEGKRDGALYVVMANTYAAAGMQEDAENIKSMRIKNTACQQAHQLLALTSPLFQ